MSTDIERLLAAAADDSDRPLQTDVDDILVRARRSVRKSRIAVVSTAALTTAAIVGSIAAWSATRPQSEGPAGTPKSQTITLDVETGKLVAPAPPVGTVSDSTIISRCLVLDKIPTWDPKPWDKAGLLNSRWTVAVKTSEANRFAAVLISPDHTVAADCQFVDDSAGPNGSLGRTRLTPVAPSGDVFRAGYADGLRVPADVTKVLVDIPGEPEVRQALMGTDGFYTLGALESRGTMKPIVGHPKPRIRGYSADGRKILDRQLPFVVLLPPIPQR